MPRLREYVPIICVSLSLHSENVRKITIVFPCIQLTCPQRCASVSRYEGLYMVGITEQHLATSKGCELQQKASSPGA